MGLRQRLTVHMRRAISSVATAAVRAVLLHPQVRRELNMVVSEHWDRRRRSINNPLLSAGAKYYSQNDEDGILLQILRRLSVDQGVFVEFGVGDGLENNTLCLLMLGWRGAWLGGEPLKLTVRDSRSRLNFTRAWVTKENCAELMANALCRLGVSAAHLISIDLDGNDLHIARELLASGARPDVFVVEYNGKFPPPIRFCIPYDPSFTWDGSDYFGASLQSFVDLFREYGYLLVCCNVTGVSAFFVAPSAAHLFRDVADQPSGIFVPASYCGFYQTGHPPAPPTVETFLRD
jgi:hypothetical protein